MSHHELGHAHVLCCHTDLCGHGVVAARNAHGDDRRAGEKAQAAKVLGQFAEGRNPAEAKREAKAEMTLGQAFEAYMSDHVEAHGVRSADDLRQMWERCLGDLPDVPKKKHARLRTKHPQGVNWQNKKLRHVMSDEVKKVHLA